MSDEDTVKSTLKQWAEQQILAEASLSEDGTTLTASDGTTTLTASIVLKVSHDGKSCEYTAAYIFQQIKDPSQGLVDYRKACKKQNVKDPVKAVDKPTVVGYFIGATSAAAAPAAAAKPPSSKKKDERKE